MFTITEIKDAHSKVKSGADFPAYISNLKQLGVTRYSTFVRDGHTDYFGGDDYRVTAPGSYPELTLAAVSQPAKFRADLKAHQNGQTDYQTFCQDCARSGVVFWTVHMKNMTCTYFDKANNEVLVERISS
jgi:uncharacterized protein YbcV (DUF1398 family)